MDHLPITSAHTLKSLSNRYQKSHLNPVNVLDLGHTLCIHKSCGCINVGSDMIETTAIWLWLYAMLGLITGWWAVTKIMDQSWDRGYWVGRAAGWQSHRRLTNMKAKSDEVFDYDNHN